MSDNNNNNKKYTLLICTVGGSPEPIVATLKQWMPVRTHFIVTQQTRGQIEGRIVPLAQAEGLDLDPGRYDVLELPDGQDLSACVNTLRKLTPVVDEWLRRGEEYQAVVDFTGGTKCMSAAVALQARRWRCVFSYVGGTERTKQGVGIVVSGKEQVLHSHNPWDALGFQAIEEFVTLFDRRAFAAAVDLANQAMRNVDDPAQKRQLNALKCLAEAYDAWDRFDHREAFSRLQEVPKYRNDLDAVFGPTKTQDLSTTVSEHCAYLQKLIESTPPSLLYVTDLLANADRRNVEGRIDDAVARLYRAIEAIAQTSLAERHKITNTKSVPLNIVPDPLRSQWASQAEEGTVCLGLQDAYALLRALGDDLGTTFQQLQLDDRQRSPLTARNQSILAHGFDRVSDKVFQPLWKAALQLAGLSQHSLPQFPRLAS